VARHLRVQEWPAGCQHSEIDAAARCFRPHPRYLWPVMVALMAEAEHLSERAAV